MFEYHHFDKEVTPPIEYHAAKEGESFQLGEALVLGDGGLTKCGATAVPTHICVGTLRQDGTLPATRVNGDIEYTAPLAVAPAEGAALKVGQKVTIHSDGMGVTATTANGVAKIVAIEGQTVGSAVRVRF